MVMFSKILTEQVRQKSVLLKYFEINIIKYITCQYLDLFDDIILVTQRSDDL